MPPEESAHTGSGPEDPWGDVFPFLLEIDASRRLSRIGPLLQRTCPQLVLGGAFDTFFEDLNPSELALFSKAEAKTHHCRARFRTRTEAALVMRGQWQRGRESGSLRFLGWPLVTSPQSLASWGLKLQDFPPHNPISDFLLVLQTSQGTLADTRDLAHRLSERSLSLQKSRDAYQALLEASPDAIAVVKNGTFVFANTQTARLLGLTSVDALLGQPLVSVLEERDRDVVLARNVWVSEGQAQPPLEHLMIRADGARVPVESSASPLEFECERALQLVMRDVRDRHEATEALRRTEEYLRQSQKMEAVGRLAGGIAHDFNNLLTAILAYTQLLTEQAGADHPWHDDLEQIRFAGESAVALTQQLLAFSRSKKVEMGALDLNDVVRQMNRLVARLLGARVRITLDLAEPLPRIEGDRGQLEQILMNLLVNARDAMPDGGAITVSTRLAPPSSTSGSQPVAPRVVLCVTDTGIGMDDDTRSRIFEPFFTTKGPTKGTGLGLTTVFGIVEACGARIDVQSAPEKGSTFVISFAAVQPACDAELDPEMRAALFARRLDGTCILVVEDDERARTTIGRLLQSTGAEVMLAEDGRQAMQLLDVVGEAFHLCIVDVVLPDISGLDLVREIRRRGLSPHVLTISQHREQLPPALDLAGLPFLSKPFTAERLLAQLFEVMDAPPQASTETTRTVCPPPSSS